MTSHTLKFVDFTKVCKSRYLKNEALFSLQINKFINYTKCYFMAKNTFVEKGVILPYQSHIILHWQVVNVTISLQINLNYCLLPTPLFNLVKILSKGSYRVCSKSCDLMVIISVSFKIGLAQLVACTSFAVQIWWLQPLLKGSFHLLSKSPYRTSMMSLALM